MKERSQININSLTRHLKRFYNSPEEAQEAINGYLRENGEASEDRIFGDLTAGRGMGKSHISAETEGDIKKGHHFLRHSKRRRW